MADGEDAGWFYYDTAVGDNGPPAGGKRQLIREGGGGGCLSGQGSCSAGTQEGEQCRLFPHNV